MSGTGRQDRGVRSQPGGQPVAQRGVEVDHRGEDSCTTSTRTPSRSARSRAACAISSTRAVSVASSAARESSQARTSEAMALVPLGSTATLPKVASAPCAGAFFRAASTVLA